MLTKTVAIAIEHSQNDNYSKEGLSVMADQTYKDSYVHVAPA